MEQKVTVKVQKATVKATVNKKYSASCTITVVNTKQRTVVLDEMNLADEVKTNWGIKRKLKRLFDDLAFEVGEYVTYEGGREISGVEIEEIDERELEISVAISRGSDSEPFTAVVSVSEVEE